MTEAQTALARRAVACKGWRWMPGMLTTEDYRVLDLWRDTLTVAKGTLVYTLTAREGGWSWHWYDPAVDGSEEDESGALLPDFSDPATLGCLLALVREAWGQDDLVAFRFDGQWCAEVTPQEGQHHAFYGSSEAEALVAALESAP